jgi:superfamily II DNA/RNA helicase
MTFEEMNLDPAIFKALVACGYLIPTPVQVQSIPHILAGKDLVASAQTGTGKTAAFVLPALQLLTLSKGVSKPRILILTPTRELAAQITQAAGKYGKFLRFNIVSLVGGMPYRQQLRELSRPVDIIVATPGRLLDHMQNHKLDLSAVEMLILDEADRMLDMGFIDDVKAIAKATPSTRQTLLFSATVDNNLSGIIRQLLKEPVRVDLSNVIMAPALIKQEAYIADNNQHKERILQHFVKNENIYKAIIFSGTKINADYLTRRLRDMDFEASALHGDLKQNVRNKTIEQFRRGRIQFLVATDVAARGIDINDVTHVINYDLPKFSEDYVHRIGRTGRAGREGTAISLVLPVDARHLQKIEKYIGEKLPFLTIPGLEPTKKMHNSAANPSAGKKKKSGGFGGFKSGSGGGYKSGAKNHDVRGYSARKGGQEEGPRSFGARSTSNNEKSFAPRGEGRSFEGRSNRSEFKPREDRGGFRNEHSGSERKFQPREERSYSRPEHTGGERKFQPREERSNSRSEHTGGERKFQPREERSYSRPEHTGGERKFQPREERGNSRPEHSERKDFRSNDRDTTRSADSRSFSARSGRGERTENRFGGGRDENRGSLSSRSESGRPAFVKRKEYNDAPRGDFKAADGKRKTFKKFPSKAGESFDKRKSANDTAARPPRRANEDPRISYGESRGGRSNRGEARGKNGRSFAKPAFAGSEDKRRVRDEG